MIFLRTVYRTVRHDIGRKILALVLAVGAWFLIRAATVTSHTILMQVVVVQSSDERQMALAQNKNVYIIELPEKLLVKDADKALTAELQLRGPKAVLEGYENWRFVGEVRLAEDFCGESPSRVYHPEDRWLRIDRLEARSDRVLRFKNAPAIEVFRGERLRLRLTPENVEITGRPAAGWALLEDKSAQLRFAPGSESPQLFGPAEAIDPIAENPAIFQLEKLDITGASGTLERNLRIRSYSERRADLPKVTMVPRFVRVFMDLREERIEKRIPNLRVLRRNMQWLTDWLGSDQGPPGIDRDHPISDPDINDEEAWTATVVLSARSSVWASHSLDSLIDRIELSVDLRQFERSSLTLEDLPILIWTPHTWPKGVQLVGVEPEKIRVILKEMKRSAEEPSRDGG